MTRTTLTRKAVNQIGGAGVVFNDRLEDGTRSLKVWGWTYDKYEKCAELLTSQGCKVSIVQFTKTRYKTKKTVTRLHVIEPN